MQSRFAVSYIEPISNPLPTANPVRCTRRLFCFEIVAFWKLGRLSLPACQKETMSPYLKICFVTRTATWHYRARLFVLGRRFDMGSK